jgi:hypothetical protein
VESVMLTSFGHKTSIMIHNILWFLGKFFQSNIYIESLGGKKRTS